GLYLSPPNRALVLSIDEKSRIQALDREQPVLPMMPGVPERRTHSYVRHGTTSLFAALDVASGFVIGKCYKRHRAAEFLNFLKEIDAQVPEGLDIHIVMDNYATQRTGHGSEKPGKSRERKRSKRPKRQQPECKVEYRERHYRANPKQHHKLSKPSAKASIKILGFVFTRIVLPARELNDRAVLFSHLVSSTQKRECLTENGLAP